jgi:hypothetical protein
MVMTPAFSDEIHDVRQEQRAPSCGRSRLDHKVRSDLMEDLLVDPQVQWALLTRHTHPMSALKDESLAGRTVVIEIVEGVDNPTRFIIHLGPHLPGILLWDSHGPRPLQPWDKLSQGAQPTFDILIRTR